MNGRIDTHQHIVPSKYAAWLAERGYTSGGLPIPSWSIAGALDVIDANAIAAAVLSLSTPGVDLGDDAEARAMAREVNDDTAAALRTQGPRGDVHADAGRVRHGGWAAAGDRPRQCRCPVSPL